MMSICTSEIVNVGDVTVGEVEEENTSGGSYMQLALGEEQNQIWASLTPFYSSQ
jgi:hypothetical protein